MFMKLLQAAAFIAGVFANIHYGWTKNPYVGTGIGVGCAMVVTAPVWLAYKIDLFLLRRAHARRLKQKAATGQAFRSRVR